MEIEIRQKVDLVVFDSVVDLRFSGVVKVENASFEGLMTIEVLISQPG